MTPAISALFSRHTRLIVVSLAAGFGAAAVATSAFAQTPALPDSATIAAIAAAVQAQLPKTPAVTAGKDGFTITSVDKAYKIKIGGYFQIDTRIYDDRPAGTLNTFLLRRIRPTLEGTVTDKYAFRFMPDFGGGSTVLYDAYGEFTPVKGVTLRAGKFKQPVGLERLTSASSLLFIERGLPTQLVATRDLGVQIGGDLRDGRISYQAGVFNGIQDGSLGDADVDNGKDIAGRLFLQPFKFTGPSALQGIGVGVAGSNGRHDGTPTAPQLTSYRSAGQQTFFRYLADAAPTTNKNKTTFAFGRHQRTNIESWYSYGRFGYQGEYATVHEDVKKDSTAVTRLAHTAWVGNFTVLLTNDVARPDGVRPAHYFDPKNGHWGAFELAVRFEDLKVDAAAFSKFADLSKSAQEAKSTAYGLNWYLTGNYKVQVNYAYTHFLGGAANKGNRPTEKAWQTRFQIKF